MISSATSAAINNISRSLGQLAAASEKISNPDTLADASDIVAYKQAASETEIGVAVLKKINQSQRLIDVIA